MRAATRSAIGPSSSRARALGRDRAQGLRVGRVRQRVASLHRRAIRPRKQCFRIREACLREVAAGKPTESLRYGEAIFSRVGCGAEEVAPGQLAEVLVRQAEHRDGSRCAGRSTAGDRVDVGERLAVRTHEHVGRGSRRRGLAAVENGDLAGLRVVVDEERAAAEARALRFHEPERCLHGHRRVRSGAAGLQDRQAGLDRERIRCADTCLAGCRAARRDLSPGLLRPRCRRMLAARQAERDEQWEAGGKACRWGHAEHRGAGTNRD